MTFDIGLHEVCVRVGVRYIITKFSRMDSLPNFLTHGAPLRARAPLLVIAQCNIDAVVFQTLKAFVTVDHTLPSSKLDCYGITGPEGDWLR